MRKIEEQEIVTKVSYEAMDGKRFASEELCREYESTATVSLKNLLAKYDRILDDALIHMQACIDSEDTEAAHDSADRILCGVLEAVGFKDLVEAYGKVEKWYA